MLGVDRSLSSFLLPSLVWQEKPHQQAWCPFLQVPCLRMLLPALFPFSLGFTFTREPSWHVSKSMQIMGFGKVVLVMAVAGQNVLKLNVLSCHR